MSETLQFAAERAAPPPRPQWTLLIVDDDPEVHAVTTLALQPFRFAGRGLTFLHAYSGAEARAMLRAQPQIAIVLLDVVMETDHAGLDVAEYLRNELRNKFIRVILRTGQPGQAPELEVITRYDINDYKHKTELTRERLFTTVYTALSTYRDLMALDANRHGLEKVIEATAELFTAGSVEHLAQGVLEQLIALLFLGEDAVMLQASGVAAAGHPDSLQIVAGTGAFARAVGHEAREALPQDVLVRIEGARHRPAPVFGEDYFVGSQEDPAFGEWLFYVGADATLREPDRRLIQMFCRNVALARQTRRLLDGKRA
ncbi:MAG TPA: DUF3369 domain-containing protein [Candidatus Binatia bacterium]|nr:DUF3369 domain-containing protein [Candidatus Binatia bacterium]